MMSKNIMSPSKMPEMIPYTLKTNFSFKWLEIKHKLQSHMDTSLAP